MLSEIYLGNLSHVNTRHWEQSSRAVYLLQKSCGCQLGVTRNRKVQCMAKREGKVSKLPNEGFLHRPGGVAAFSQFPNCSNQPFSGTSAPGVARNPLEQQELRVFYAELSETLRHSWRPALHKTSTRTSPQGPAFCFSSHFGKPRSLWRSLPHTSPRRQAARCTPRHFAPLTHPPEPAQMLGHTDSRSQKPSAAPALVPQTLQSVSGTSHLRDGSRNTIFRPQKNSFLQEMH